MGYINKYNIDLIEIIKLIEQNKIKDENGALEKLNIHLSEVIQIGRYNSNDWNHIWRANVYKFGEKFSSLDPVNFLKIFEEIKKGKSKDEKEVLDFYKSEIDFNSLPPKNVENKLKKLILKYPYNPEFRHTYGHYLKSKKQFLAAIDEYKFAFEKNTNDHVFKTSYFNSYTSYFEDLIEKSKYEKGYEISKELLLNKIFFDDPHLHN